MAVPPTKSILDSAQIDQFHEDGYLVVEGLLNGSHLQPVIDELNHEIDKRARTLFDQGKISKLYEKEGFDTRLAKLSQETDEIALSIWHGVLDGPAIFSLIASSPLVDVAEALCGCELIASSVYRVRPKIPAHGNGEVPWHQDSGYFEPFCDNALVLTCWVPLIDSTKDNGCLYVIPGSHHGPVVRHVMNESGRYLKIPQNVLPEGQAVCCPVKKGSVLLLSNRTAHASFSNSTQQVRWSLDLRYQNAELPTNALGDRKKLTPQVPLPPDAPIACYPPEADFLVRSSRWPDRVVRTAEEFHQIRTSHVGQPVKNRWGVTW